MSSDLLSAAALLLTFVTILYSLWYPEITKVIDIKVQKEKVDNRANYKSAKTVLKSKAIPLAIASFSFGLILIPDAFKIIHLTYTLFWNGKWNYSAINTSLVFLTFYANALSFYNIMLYREVRKKCTALKPD